MVFLVFCVTALVKLKKPMVFLVLIVFSHFARLAPADILASWLAGWKAVNSSMAELENPEKPLKPKKPLVFNVLPMPQHKKPKKQLFFKLFGVPAFKNH